jgi:hypothetical protein
MKVPSLGEEGTRKWIGRRDREGILIIAGREF